MDPKVYYIAWLFERAPMVNEQGGDFTVLKVYKLETEEGLMFLTSKLVLKKVFNYRKRR